MKKNNIGGAFNIFLYLLTFVRMCITTNYNGVRANLINLLLLRAYNKKILIAYMLWYTTVIFSCFAFANYINTHCIDDDSFKSFTLAFAIIKSINVALTLYKYKHRINDRNIDDTWLKYVNTPLIFVEIVILTQILFQIIPKDTCANTNYNMKHTLQIFLYFDYVAMMLPIMLFVIIIFSMAFPCITFYIFRAVTHFMDNSNGAGDEIISNMTVKQYVAKPNEEADKCAICYDEFAITTQVKVFPCEGQHEFHVNCIDTWLKLHSTCPMCRFDLKPINDDDGVVV